jgi:hypothetical protein
LVRHPDVDKITFTGSTAAGRRIASLCGERIARCTLELGGKSAAVVLDDCDVGKTAESISGTSAAIAPKPMRPMYGIESLSAIPTQMNTGSGFRLLPKTACYRLLLGMK